MLCYLHILINTLIQGVPEVKKVSWLYFQKIVNDLNHKWLYQSLGKVVRWVREPQKISAMPPRLPPPEEKYVLFRQFGAKEFIWIRNPPRTLILLLKKESSGPYDNWWHCWSFPQIITIDYDTVSHHHHHHHHEPILHCSRCRPRLRCGLQPQCQQSSLMS